MISTNFIHSFNLKWQTQLAPNPLQIICCSIANTSDNTVIFHPVLVIREITEHSLQGCTRPTRKVVHVTCMLHELYWWLRVACYMHMLYMHVACNIQGFGTFSMYVTCMLHPCNITPNMLGKHLSMVGLAVGIYWGREVQNEYLYAILHVICM